MKKLSFLSLMPIVLLIFSCHKEIIDSPGGKNPSIQQDQLSIELSKIQSMKFKEIPLEQILERNKFIPQFRDFTPLVKIKGNQFF